MDSHFSCQESRFAGVQALARLMVVAGEPPRPEATKVLPRRFAIATMAATILGAAVRTTEDGADPSCTLGNPT